MGDQIIGIYLVPFVAQVVIPLVLLAWQAFGAERSRAGRLIKTSAVGAYLLAISIAGVWLAVPWYASVLYLLIFITHLMSRRRTPGHAPWWPKNPQGWMAIAGAGALGICAAGLAVYGLSGRQPPKEDVVDLEFPLRNGAYFIVAGGSNELLNPHVDTLTPSRFKDYRGQSYGLDIVAVNSVGMRASTIISDDPGKYVVFGTPVYAPCSGAVLRAEGGFPDMGPPQPDRDHLTGNYVLLDCGGRQVFLGHFQRNSVGVQPGQLVPVGSVIGRVGNSGNTGEPHLHIHAQRPSPDAAFMAGDPIPIRFNGRFLVRNDWVRRNVGFFAPPVSGIVALSALFLVGWVYWFPMRNWFRTWGATKGDLERIMEADAEIPNPNYRTTLGITIDAPPVSIWPWLVQMGYQRGGLYSYDWLDRLFGYLDRPSADRVLEKFQQLFAGDVIPLGVGGGFPVLTVERYRTLLLGGDVEQVHWAWELGLFPLNDSQTRLISRNCVHGPHSLKDAVLMRLLEPAAFIMTRKMLLGIKRRAEALAKRESRPNRAA